MSRPVLCVLVCSLLVSALAAEEEAPPATAAQDVLDMSRPVLCVLVCSLLVSALAAEEEAPPAAAAQDALGLLASLQQASDGSSNELRKAATMYELLQLAALQQQQRQRLAELEEREREEGEELPLPLPLQGRLATLQDNDEYLKDKRGSYMSLCHFKICNMGKRSPYWNSWGRI